MTPLEQPSDESRTTALRQVCARLGIDPGGPRLEQALVHPSFTNEASEGPAEDNQRLEFLGDAVLALCVSEQLMADFLDADEGELTVMRAALVNAGALGAFAREIGLGDALLLGRGAVAAGERLRTNVLGDALEAVVGAVYLDHGLDAARALSLIVVADGLRTLRAQGGSARDPKSRLQELLQADGRAPPRYLVVAEQGPAHARSFRVEVTIEREHGEAVVAGEGEGGSKKLAEQAAAAAALQWLRLSDPAAPTR